MKRIMIMMIVVAFSVSICVKPARADDPEARAIMEKVDALDDGDNRTADMEMVLIDRHNRKRVRWIATYTKDRGEDTYRLMFFLQPADVRDTGFLTYDYDDPARDDDQWLYLPALKKTKRIATDDKSGSFMGSDLNYSDMTSRNLDDYDFFLKKEIDVRGYRAWVIEAVPRSDDVVEKTGYTKSLLIVRRDNYFVVRSVHWVKDGGYLKYVDVTGLERIDGIWVATETHIARKKGQRIVHQTLLRLHDVKFGQDLHEDFFSIRRLEKGAPSRQ